MVVPIYNEEDGVREFLDGQLLPVMKNLKYNLELVLVDDGSNDKTLEKIKKCKIVKAVDSNVISFSRNFGKEVALTAGLKEARGDAVVMIDADGQHPAEMISEMVRKWEDGAEIVTAVRTANSAAKARFAAEFTREGSYFV